MSSELISLSTAIPLAGVVGLFVGSFLNVVIYRAPLGLSVSTPRSFCPTCNRQLTWWENIPLASWMVLRGKCRTCHDGISVRYPLVELTTGVTFSLVTWVWLGTLVAAGYCVLVAAMIAISLIEFGGQRAPLSISAIGTLVAQVIIAVGAGLQHHWQIVTGSLSGTAAAVVLFSLLRVHDPECVDARGHGRSALLIAGCWVGGMGLFPFAVASGTWITAYFLCMLGSWAVVGRRLTTDGGGGASIRTANPLLSVPLISALGLAMAASLIATNQ
jgi:leader peptidase (prepilin peptidase)/N-methyltransferase